jgi:hypothetical protein
MTYCVQPCAELSPACSPPSQLCRVADIRISSGWGHATKAEGVHDASGAQPLQPWPLPSPRVLGPSQPASKLSPRSSPLQMIQHQVQVIQVDRTKEGRRKTVSSDQIVISTKRDTPFANAFSSCFTGSEELKRPIVIDM